MPHDFDWDHFVRLARWHGVVPFAWRYLKNAPDVPPGAFAQLKSAHAGNALNSLFLARELARLTRLFDAAGIQTIAFKGPVLALDAYGDLTMRQFSDLDLLFRRADVPRAATILIGERYLPRRYRPDAPAASLERYFEDEFIRENKTHLVDCHWELAPRYFPYGPAGEAVWHRAVRRTVEGAEVSTLGPIDLLLFLCVHGTKHGWVSLGWVCDLVQVLRVNPALNIAELLAEARRTGATRMLLLGMMLAQKLLGAEIPAPLTLLCAADPSVIALGRGIAARMFAKVDLRPGLFAEWIVPLRTIEGRGARAAYIARRAIRPTIEDCEFIPLPDALYPLYYALRPLRLLIQQAQRVLRDVPTVEPFRPRKLPP
jgi:hypothetical protein